ncbi:glycoside hydrolase family 32 protein [Corynebacterium sp. 335C]
MTDAREPLRPTFHLTPPTGRMNDPNGLLLDGGVWHARFQHDPDWPSPDGRIGWGHATSPDLVHWTHHGPALRPDDGYDRDGCFSGCAVPADAITAADAPAATAELFFTGNVGDDDSGRGTAQCLAFAGPAGEPGAAEPSAAKDPRNPLVDGPAPGFTAHYRDPQVIPDPWAEPGDADAADADGAAPDDPADASGGCGWAMILGAQTGELGGAVVVHRSPDRRTWGPARRLVVDGPAPAGYMWECPNLLLMDDAVTGARRAVLLLCPQGIRAEDGDELRNRHQCGYLVGTLRRDGDDPVFAVEEPFRELDRGFEFYAPQVFAGTGRHILLGWMGLPDEDDHPTSATEGWLHCLTAARELELADGRLLQRPILPGDDELPVRDDGSRAGVLRAGFDGDGALLLADGAGTGLEVRLSGDRAEVRRTQAGRPNPFGDVRAVDLRPRPGGAPHHLELVVDRSAVEIVADDGAEMFALRLFAAGGAPWTLTRR